MTIMKKFLCFLPAAAAIALASCSSEEPVVNTGGDGNVTFTATLPSGMASRSFSDGTKATRLTYAVYEENTTTPVIKSGDPGAPEVSFQDLRATLSLTLVKGKTYDVVFWADVPTGSPYTFHPESQTITVDYEGIQSGDENRDAFFQVEKGLKVSGAVNKNIQLFRPFAQLNVGTDDLAVAAATNTTVTHTSMKVSQVYSELNLITGEVNEPTQITYAMAPIPADEDFPPLVNSGKAYDYLSMNYLLVAADKALVDCEMVINDNTGKEVNTLSFANVPVQRNYRTNIFGSLLTSPSDFNIVIEKDYEQPDYEIEYVEATTAQDFAAAIAAGSNVLVPQTATVDVTDLITSDPGTNLTIDKPTRIKVDGTLTANQQGRINVTSDLKISGGGTIVTGEDSYGIFNMMPGSSLVVEDMVFEHNNKLDGSPLAMRSDCKITLNRVTFNSDFGIVGSWDNTEGATLEANDCTINSTSNSARNGSNWTYAVNIKGDNTATLNNCTVIGVQGGVSASHGARLTINGGTYRTVYLPEEPKANPFYAVYVAQEAEVVINGGSFISADGKKPSVYNGNNDISGDPLGNLVLKGGIYNNQGYTEGTKDIIVPGEGYKWEANSDAEFPWKVVENK